MNIYNIKINGKWFVNMGEVNGQTTSGGWYDLGQDTRELILSADQTKAKKVAGMRNLNSHFNKIYDSSRMSGKDIQELSFIKVGEE